MAGAQIELAFRRVERELAVQPGAINLGERNGARFSRRPNERDRHFIRHIERLDENRFVPLQAGGILDENFGELVVARIMHSR